MPFQNSPNICPVCLKKSSFKFIKDYQSKEGKFSLYECSKCNVQFWLPFQNPGANWYENQERYKRYETQPPELHAGYHKGFLRSSPVFPKNTRVLDLGCGTGVFIAELQKRGYEVWGVDFNKKAIEAAKNYYGLKNVYAMSFDNFFKLPDLPQFEIITFFEVIEHLDDPLEFIQKSAKLLEPNGRIILSIPSRERIMSNVVKWDFPPNHLTRWSEKMIKKLLQEINFEVISVSYVDSFRVICETLAGKSIGLMIKTEKLLRVNKQNKNNIKMNFIKLINTPLAYLKNYIFPGIPASFLWFISKILRIKNGIIVIEFTPKYDRGKII